MGVCQDYKIGEGMLQEDNMRTQNKQKTTCDVWQTMRQFSKAGVQKVGVRKRWEMQLESQEGYTAPAH